MGHLHPIWTLYERRAPSRPFAPFPKQNDKFLTNARGEGGLGTLGIGWAIKEYRFVIVYLIPFRRFVEPATVRSPYFSVRSTLVDHLLFLKMNFYQPSKRKWAKLCHFILSGFYYLFLCILSELQNKSIRNSAFYVQCFAAMSFPLINSHYTLAQQFFSWISYMGWVYVWQERQYLKGTRVEV